MIGSPCLHRAHIEAPWRADVHTVKSDADLMPRSSVARMSTAIAELDEGEFTTMATSEGDGGATAIASRGKAVVG